MDNGNLSASDVALLTGNGGYGMNGWGDSSFMWVLALLVLAGGGFGGWGGGFQNAIGYSNLATQNDVQRGFDTLGLQDQSRDILAAITSGTAQAVAATNQAKYDNINVAKDIQTAITSQLGDIRTAQVTALANQNECCCSTLRAIDNLSYQGAMNTAAINETTTAQTQKILDAITSNRMADMQNQINDLQLQNAMAGVLRYPNSWAYNAGTNPFCNNSCGCGCMSV